MIATLPMYDWPEVRAQTDRLWQAIRRRLREAGIDAPAELARGKELLSLWLAPDLVLAQTCGYPFSTALAGKVALVATPAYAIDCAPGRYFSVLVAQSDKAGRPLGAIASLPFAYNATNSQSGFRAPQRLLAASGDALPGERLETGSHRGSIRAVAAGRAGFAAIDAVTWELALRHEPAAGDLAVIARTPETPGLPLITAMQNEDRCRPIADAVAAAIADLDTATRRVLLLEGVAATAPGDYTPLAEPIVSA